MLLKREIFGVFFFWLIKCYLILLIMIIEIWINFCVFFILAKNLKKNHKCFTPLQKTPILYGNPNLYFWSLLFTYWSSEFIIISLKYQPIRINQPKPNASFFNFINLNTVKCFVGVGNFIHFLKQQQKQNT